MTEVSNYLLVITLIAKHSNNHNKVTFENNDEMTKFKIGIQVYIIYNLQLIFN
jgi:hypothetical protein